MFTFKKIILDQIRYKVTYIFPPRKIMYLLILKNILFMWNIMKEKNIWIIMKNNFEEVLLWHTDQGNLLFYS